jgi:6-phosphogluconolactonase
VRLRLNLLGLGPDGHTASLFPHSPGLHERERRAIAVNPGLEPFVRRVTMTPPMLANADVVLFLVTGRDKAEAVARAFEEPETDAVPAGRIRSRDGRTLVVLDREAAERLSALI